MEIEYYETWGWTPASELRGVSKQRPTVYKSFGLRSSLQSRGRQLKEWQQSKGTRTAVEGDKLPVKGLLQQSAKKKFLEVNSAAFDWLEGGGTFSSM